MRNNRQRAHRWGPRKLLQFGMMVASSAGISSSTGVSRGSGRVEGTSAGASLSTSTLRGSGSLVVSVFSFTPPRAIVSGSLRASLSFAVVVSGTSSTSVTGRGAGRSEALSNAVASSAATLVGDAIFGPRVGIVSGTSSASGTMRARGTLFSLAAGTVTFIARLGSGALPGSMDAMHALIRSRWSTQVETAVPVPTHYDNAPFDKPEGARWVRMMVITDNALHVATNKSDTFRTFGSIRAEIHIPLEVGDSQAHAVADAVSAAFDNVTLNTELTFRQSRIDGSRRGDSDYVVNVSVPFQNTVTQAKIAGVSGDSTGFEQIANHIRERYESQITVGESIDTQFDNAPFEIPEGGLWSQCIVRFGDREVSELGANLKHRTIGMLVGTIFVPVETGERDGLQAADKVKDAFRLVTVKGVTFRAPTVRNVGRIGPWWQISTTVPFMVSS